MLKSVFYFRRETHGQVLSLAWPIASAMLGETIMGLVDTKLVGTLGPTALGGVGLANSVLYLSYVGMVGLMRGVKINTAHAVGGGRAWAGRRYMQAGLFLGIIMGILLGFFFQEAALLFTAMGSRADLLPPAQLYLAARGWGVPAACALAALIEYRQGLGDVHLPMAIGLGGNVINAFLAYGLIHGAFGLPTLGVAGAGFGTAIAEWVQLACMVGFLSVAHWRGQARGRLFDGFDAWWAALKEVTQVGLPTGLHLSCEYLAFAACTAILSTLGDADVAAHQIAIVINRLAYLPGLAIGEVACILVGRALGAGRLDEAEQTVRSCLGVAVLFMVLVGLAFALSSARLAGIFSNDPQIVSLASTALWIAGFFQILDAVNVVMRGALRGAKDVRAAAILGVSIIWVTVPSVTYVLGNLAGWGVVGGWCSFVLETAVCALLFARRWRSGGWRQHMAPVVAAPVAA